MSDGASERGNDRARQDSQAQMMRWREMGGVEVGGRAAKAVQGWGHGHGCRYGSSRVVVVAVYGSSAVDLGGRGRGCSVYVTEVELDRGRVGVRKEWIGEEHLFSSNDLPLWIRSVSPTIDSTQTSCSPYSVH